MVDIFTIMTQIIIYAVLRYIYMCFLVCGIIIYTILAFYVNI